MRKLEGVLKKYWEKKAMIKRAKNYQPENSEIFFIDNNIWITIVGSMQPTSPNIKKIRNIYTKLLSKILQNNSIIIVSSLLISEYINASLRLEYNHLKAKLNEKNPSEIFDFKKDFRGSEQYIKAMKFINSTLKSQIYKVSKIIDDDFAYTHSVLDYGKLETADFNDLYYFELCKKNNLTLITHDVDFKEMGTEIDIVTANYNMYT